MANADDSLVDEAEIDAGEDSAPVCHLAREED